MGGTSPQLLAPPLDRDDRQGDCERLAVELLGELGDRRQPLDESLVVEWEALLDEFSGGDAAIKDRMHLALHADALLQRRWALDASLMEFVQRARNVGRNGSAIHGRA